MSNIFLDTHLEYFSRHGVPDIVVARILYMNACARVLLIIERGYVFLPRVCTRTGHLVTRPGPLPLALPLPLVDRGILSVGPAIRICIRIRVRIRIRIRICICIRIRTCICIGIRSTWLDFAPAAR